jgi:hypothetical protein
MINIAGSLSPVETTSTTYICIISDLTDASNTCKKHVINLSASYHIEHLVQEAANNFSYDPMSFNLMWKCNQELVCFAFSLMKAS